MFESSIQKYGIKNRRQRERDTAPTKEYFSYRAVLVAFATALLATISCIYIYSAGLNGPPIRSDGFGYYAYLPSLFIDHDLSFHLAMMNAPKGFSLEHAYGIGVNPSTGKMFDKYTLGTAALGIPFFLIADISARIFGFARTGYSMPYQICNVAAGIFYLSLGTAVLFGTLRRRSGSMVAVMVLFLVVFATSVFHYGTYDASFSHIYSYAAISVYIAMLLHYRDSAVGNWKWYPAAIGLMLACITVIRVPNAIVGLLAVGLMYEKAFCCSDQKRFLCEFFSFSVAFFVGVLPLLGYWHYAAGSLLVNPYQAYPLSNGSFEGFHWTDPEVLKFLFSVQKGLFFWSPTILLSFVALPILVKRDKFLGALISMVLCLHIYVCSSWWAWHFGGSFGSRPFVDMMPIVALPLAVGVSSFRKFCIASTWVFIAILVTTNLTLMYAYWSGYIPFGGATINDIGALPRMFMGVYAVDQAKHITLDVNDVRFTNGQLNAQITIKNGSTLDFYTLSTPRRPVRMSWRFVRVSSQTGEPLSQPGWDTRRDLAWKIAAGESLKTDISAVLPTEEPGSYLFEVSLVQEGVAWFHDRGMKIASVPIFVEGAKWQKGSILITGINTHKVPGY